MPEDTKRININLPSMFLVVLLLVLAATGNCSTCGFDHDYVADITECSP